MAQVELYVMLVLATLTDDPLVAVIALVLKLASLLWMLICAVAASAFIPSDVAFSMTERLTVMLLFVFASIPMLSRITLVLSIPTSTFGAMALAARMPTPPL